MQVGNAVAAPTAGGLSTRLVGVLGENASRIENFVIDRATGGWSSRVGYEKFDPKASSLFDPFGSIGPIYSVHVHQGLSGGARQSILFEAGGSLYLLYEASGSPLLRTLQAGRHIPTAMECSSWFTDVGDGVIVTNGVDRPVYVKPWPLGSSAESSTTITQCIRPFGFIGKPPAPSVHRNTAMASGIHSSTITGGGATTLWCPNTPGAISDGGKWGFGYSKGDGNESLFGWAMSFISDTGSESPISDMITTAWRVDGAVTGWKHAIALDVSVGPAGTVARKFYRTGNFSDDWSTPNDTTLGFVGLLRNNVEDVYFDAVKVPNFALTPSALDTGPLPTTHPRFSGMFGGCLFLDGGSEDPRSLFYSAPGLIEQFSPANVLQLGGAGGGITALFSNYNTLVIFRENGIDIVEGDYTNGFTVKTVSESITCRSPKSIQSVPGVGVVFLAQDGVYAVVGGLVGGAEFKVISLTDGQTEFINRVTPGCSARAVSVYSPKFKEYQLYIPMNGQDRPTRGLILHVDRLGELSRGLSPWSVRVGFPVGDIACLYGGAPIFGHHTGIEAGANSEAGIFVISAKRALGGTITGDNAPVYNIDAAPVSVYRSEWNDFGDSSVKKSVKYVELKLMSTGTTPLIQLRPMKDFNYNQSTTPDTICQPADVEKLPVFDTAIFGVAKYEDEHVISLRIAVSNGACTHFAFEISTQEDITLLGYTIEFEVGPKVIPGKKS